jgi:hypothetical protein
MDSSERKKQTHLRCERQRREAINVSKLLNSQLFEVPEWIFRSEGAFARVHILQWLQSYKRQYFIPSRRLH